MSRRIPDRTVRGLDGSGPLVPDTFVTWAEQLKAGLAQMGVAAADAASAMADIAPAVGAFEAAMGGLVAPEPAAEEEGQVARRAIALDGRINKGDRP